MCAKIRWSAGAGGAWELRLGAGEAAREWVLGRARDSSVVLLVPPQAGVSRRHAALAATRGEAGGAGEVELRVRDRGSRFGTWVLPAGGSAWERVPGGAPGRAVGAGDVLRLGASGAELGDSGIAEILLTILSWEPEGGRAAAETPGSPPTSAPRRRSQRLAASSPLRRSQRLAASPSQAVAAASPRRSLRRKRPPPAVNADADAEGRDAGGRESAGPASSCEEVPNSGEEEDSRPLERRAASRRRGGSWVGPPPGPAHPPPPKRPRGAAPAPSAAARPPLPFPVPPTAFVAARPRPGARLPETSDGYRLVACPGKSFRKQSLAPAPPPLHRLAEFRNDCHALYTEYAEDAERERAREAAADALFRDSARAHPRARARARR